MLVQVQKDLILLPNILPESQFHTKVINFLKFISNVLDISQLGPLF